MDMSMLTFKKGTPRVVDRIQAKREQEAQVRACRKAVTARDKGRCVVPGCKAASAHMHHLVYRARGGRNVPENCCSLCVPHHQMVHAALFTITRRPDGTLHFEGTTTL